MKFLHLSDIHFLREYPKAEKGYNSIFNNMTTPLLQIKRCLDKIELNDVDFIIITGDLVESGEWEDYKVLKKELEGMFNGIPYFITLGNHDNKEAFYEGWYNKEGSESYNVLEDIGELKVIGFDSSQYKNSNGFISNNQYSWLKNQLEINEGKDIILMSHHHLIKEQFTTEAIQLKPNFEDIIRKSSVIGIFVGHTHHPYEGIFGDKPYFTAGSLSFVGYDESNGIVRFEESAKCSLCTYSNGKISVEIISAIDDNRVLKVVDFKE